MKRYALAQAFFLGAHRGGSELLLRQRYPIDPRSADTCEIAGVPAPTGAYIQRALPRLNQQLGRKMPLLGKLGIVERLIRIFEIGATVLPVGIEKYRVETAVQIIVMRNVSARPDAGIQLLDATEQEPDKPLQLCPR